MTKTKIPKKGIKLKGIRAPLFIYRFQGRLDEKAGLVIEAAGRYCSEFIAGKQKKFGDFAAKHWEYVAFETQSLRENKIRETAELVKLEAKIKEYESKPDKGGDIKSIRAARSAAAAYAGQLKRKTDLENNIKLIDSRISLAELQTEEILLSNRRRMEAVIAAYLRGARKKLNDERRILIAYDSPSVEYYRRYLRNNVNREEAY